MGQATAGLVSTEAAITVSAVRSVAGEGSDVVDAERCAVVGVADGAAFFTGGVLVLAALAASMVVSLPPKETPTPKPTANKAAAATDVIATKRVRRRESSEITGASPALT